MDLMPADIQLSGMEVSLVNTMSRETILRQYLDTVKGKYFHILIDCQPSLGMLTVNALAAVQDAGQSLTQEKTEHLEASRSRKKNAYQELKTQAETDPAAAAELARRRAYHTEATKKSRQKMYEEAAAGNPEAPYRPLWALRETCLEQYRHRLYTAFVASEKLYPHFAETDRAARDMLTTSCPALPEKREPPKPSKPPIR